MTSLINRAWSPVRSLFKLNRRGITVMTSGIRPGQRQVLASVGALDLLRLEGREYATTPKAIAGARSHLECAGVLPALPVQRSNRTTTAHDEPVR